MCSGSVSSIFVKARFSAFARNGGRKKNKTVQHNAMMGNKR